MAELKRLLALALVLWLPGLVSANNHSRRETVYQGHVTLEIPVSWHKIPEDQLELDSLRTAEVSGGLITELYQHGYRPGEPELEFALPQILIQIRESGRLNYRQFLELPLPDEMSEIRTMPINNLELDNAFFDRERYLLSLTNNLGTERQNMISVLSASFLTERGLLTLHCYTYATQATVIAPIFDQIVDSVRIDDDLRYRPRFGDRWPPGPNTLAFAAAGISIVILLILELRRRRRPRS